MSDSMPLGLRFPVNKSENLVYMNKFLSKNRGFLALSPLLVFLLVYLTSSLVARDFYTVPMSFSFFIAAFYAMCISVQLDIIHPFRSFAEGATQKNILLMIGIFLLASVFAKTAQEIGAIDAIVNVSMHMLPGNFIFAGLFLAACFISMSIGTSVGTIVALVPIASGIAGKLSAGGNESFICSAPFITAIIVGGAFFGDNLSFISDTTIAATRTQGCSMADKFKANFRIVAPAALIVTIIYILIGTQIEHQDVNSQTGNWLLLIPYLLVIILALFGVKVLYVLAIGILCNVMIGLVESDAALYGLGVAAVDGIVEMADLIVVTLLAGGMLQIIRKGGGLTYIVDKVTDNISSKRGAEFSIAGLVSFANVCTANNTIAIISVGSIAKDISERFGLDPRKTASILDTFSCLIQGILPYGAQLLLASSLAGITPLSIIRHLYYPIILGLCIIIAIYFRLPRKYS